MCSQSWLTNLFCIWHLVSLRDNPTRMRLRNTPLLLTHLCPQTRADHHHPSSDHFCPPSRGCQLTKCAWLVAGGGAEFGEEEKAMLEKLMAEIAAIKEQLEATDKVRSALVIGRCCLRCLVL